MIKLKNVEIINYHNILKEFGEKAPIKDKWRLTLAIEDLINKAALIQNELNIIIDKEGVEDEKTNKKVISNDNDSVKELLAQETDVKISKFDIEELEPFGIPMDILLVLKKIIK